MAARTATRKAPRTARNTPQQAPQAPPTGPFPASLGSLVAHNIETHLVHGPGDVYGQPVVLTGEERRFLDAAYALDPASGRRIVQRGTYSRRKGHRKSELMAWVTIMEALFPVRATLHRGQPVAVRVTDPWCILAATTQDQTDDTVYGAVQAILRASPEVSDMVDVGQEVTNLVGRSGKITAPAMNPTALDGGKPTFEGQEETHLWFSARLRECDQVMMRNLRKRPLSQPWQMTVTTGHKPGQNSVGERHHTYGLRVQADPAMDPSVYYDHLEASPAWDLSVDAQLRQAIREAAGDATWFDMDYLVGQYNDPDVEESVFRRFWLNQSVAGADQFATPTEWNALTTPGESLKPGDTIVLGFDGSVYDDSTALVAVRLHDGFTQLLACWSRPEGRDGEGWSVPRGQVKRLVAHAMNRYQVARFEADPPFWRDEIAAWRATYGSVVREFHTNRPTTMGPAIERAQSAIRAQSFAHDGNGTLAEHVTVARLVDDRGYPRLAKPRDGSKIDAAVAWTIAYDARGRVLGDQYAEPEEPTPLYGFAAWS